MATIYGNVAESVGRTPVIRVKSLETPNSAFIYAKLESRNPGGSVKDRIALYMINDAEMSGKLKPGMTIVEPTSGNTGIGLALVGGVKGYGVVLVMPETMTVERRQILQALGAKLIITVGDKANMSG
ncbi:MAG TPA: pyridoxal-phosphate dependent enzyme, partial [Candidatus Micrarchaeota archaeon]|nr:pyridoxal-phosphate dependent enzyme [Candidatus Micrarchaeota archaeon]